MDHEPPPGRGPESGVAGRAPPPASVLHRPPEPAGRHRHARAASGGSQNQLGDDGMEAVAGALEGYGRLAELEIKCARAPCAQAPTPSRSQARPLRAVWK